jgi:hypothetical protein
MRDFGIEIALQGIDFVDNVTVRRCQMNWVLVAPLHYWYVHRCAAVFNGEGVAIEGA